MKGRIGMDFKVGDKVYASDWCEGMIIEIVNDFASVEFSTDNGGGCLQFELDELEHIPNNGLMKGPHRG